jgi:hypothetical protein
MQNIWCRTSRRDNTTIWIFMRLEGTSYINISAKKTSRSDWGSNLWPTATPPSNRYQRFSPLCQIAILKRMVLWTVAFRHDT